MVPQEIKASLWSYDLSSIDLNESKEIVITQVLNWGTDSALQWLFKKYNKEDIKNTVVSALPGMWNKKSFNFWCIFFGIKKEFPAFRNIK